MIAYTQDTDFVKLLKSKWTAVACSFFHLFQLIARNETAATSYSSQTNF